ncbi:M20 metallopeptidase family protein [Halobacillus litoralis]|uniref:M20 metallopeptidase family protein n=1 Tax=Halobacillus litoralis TaxID=45668 RepID=UPI001CD2DFF5|nr:amidohydrolase [Halobacillus litoralis]MCA1020715.1 amidohydrolase [Halobacillus litoralis]
MKTRNPDLALRARQLFEQLIIWRRDFHRHPERSFQEKRTSETVAAELRKLPLYDVEEMVGGYGVVAAISHGEGPVIGLRADMDALPIQETTSHSFSSLYPGVMHACGHDAHMAVLLGAARLLHEDAVQGNFNGTVKLIFQPAEECCDSAGETGAVKMLQTGRLDDVQRLVALHMCPWRKTGEVQWHDGPSMANNDEFSIVIHGSGGHAGYPQHVNDPIWIASSLLGALYSLNGRRMDPLDIGTLSIGKIEAGEAGNIIPDRLLIKGTIRSYKESVRNKLVEELKQTVTLVTALGGSYDLSVQRGEPALVNDPEVNRAVRKAASGFKLIEEPFGMGSEDFSYYTKTIPGAMFFLGCGLKEEKSLHQSDFDLDEQALPFGVQVLLGSAYELLERGG